MPLNTFTVATAVTPSVIETYFSHYLHKKSLREKPTAHISYHEGLRLVRQFLGYASKHTVEELQAFTSQWVPAPTWVRTKDIEVAPQFILRAANVLHAHLGPSGIERVGGKTWWQWRRPETPLRAEWIGMKRDDNERQKLGVKCDRVIMYIHGGAYFFGSVDEHRYQMQRHARKLKARLLAPRYRLAPQFPFPCGLQDCLATYFYLLEHFPPEQIICMGDSAGGGMTISMLVILRDQGLPLPAGVVLLSPWVDLTHSFPSVAGDGELDYIPAHGFLHRPSMAWPPAPFEQAKKTNTEKEFPSHAVELPATSAAASVKSSEKKTAADASPLKHDETDLIPGIGSSNLRIELDGETIELKDQIQLYTTNQLLSYPLVSPVLQPSLGGLPPMLIQVGGGELLKDEQIYLAHKAANPEAYPPSDVILDEFDPRREIVTKYQPTYVQLQVWDDLCHVPHTLSFTTPAKFMYRSVAQFGAWALARSQRKSIDIPDDDAASISSSEESRSSRAEDGAQEKMEKQPRKTVGRAGDPLPPFQNHMLRQRVDRHGIILPMPAEADIAALHLEPTSIGRIKPGPVRKWINAKRAHERRFAKEKAKIYSRRVKELEIGYDAIEGERPPPTALAGRRRRGVAPEEQKKSRRSWGLAMWSGWGSKHDEEAIREEKRLETEAYETVAESGSADVAQTASPDGVSANLDVPQNGARKRAQSTASRRSQARSRALGHPARSFHRRITDDGQAGEYAGSTAGLAPSSYLRRPSTATSLFESRPVSSDAPVPVMYASPDAITTTVIAPDSAPVPGTDHTYLNPKHSRPHNGVAAYPFKLKNSSPNPSTMTLDSIPLMEHAHSTNNTNAASFTAVELPAHHQDDHSTTRLVSSPVSPDTPSRATTLSMDESLSPTSPVDVAVSPIESTTATPTSFQSSGPVFNNRTSVIGRIGADGMPFSTMPDTAIVEEDQASAANHKTVERPALETFVTAPEPDHLLRK